MTAHLTGRDINKLIALLNEKVKSIEGDITLNWGIKEKNNAMLDYYYGLIVKLESMRGY